MERTEISEIRNKWYTHPAWMTERPLIQEFLTTPPVMLVRAVFAMPGSDLRLPYWNFSEDAKSHALYMVRRGVNGTDEIASDYANKMLKTSRDIISDNGQLQIRVQSYVDGLLNSDLPIATSAVLAKRFGLDGISRTYAATGAELGFGLVEISTLEANGLKLLRHPSRSKAMAGYLQERRLVFLKYLYESGIMKEDSQTG